MKWTKIKEYPFSTNGMFKDWKPRTDLFWEFVNYFGFDRMTHCNSVGSFKRLLCGERSYNNTKNRFNRYGYGEEKVPEQDHFYIFKKNGTNNIVCVNQPYQFNLEDLEEWCNERNLVYVVCNSKYSFYYPCGTEMLLIMSQDTYMDFCNFLDFPQKWQQ